MRALFVISLLAACSPTTPTGAHDAEVEVVLASVKADTQNLLFVYKGADGPEMTEAIAEIPQSARVAVQVIDQNLSPAQRGAGQFVQIFDLRAPGPDGGYPGRLIPRAGLEAALAEAQTIPKQQQIIMYSTAWCGVCRKASAFMAKEGLAFVEKDIEKDKAAAKEYAAKMKAAGKPGGGVPVFDVGGQILSGFDQATLLRLAKGG